MYFTGMAREVLEIQEFMSCCEESILTGFNDWRCEMFQQMWGNTSGGFEGIGGSAMTMQNTYVVYSPEYVYVFFGGRFAYKVKTNKEILEDIKNKNIAGKMSYKRRYEEE